MYTDGLVISDNYRILEQIGEGGYGLIFKAEQISTGQTVAVKTLKVPQVLKELGLKQQLSRFERETQLCAQVNHPHIVKLLDKGYSASNEPYAVFEFVQGETLKKYILETGGLNPNEVGDIMGQILDALAYVHQKGIIHRDLKPQNIMVVTQGARKYAKILDFGIGALAQDSLPQDYKHLTMTHELLGTPTYSAPEQLRGEPTTIKSDLYAWGLMVIECLTGQPVMNGHSVAEVFQQQLATANVPIPPAVLDHPLGSLLKRVLEKSPVKRLGNAQQIFSEFENINFNTITGTIQGLPAEFHTSGWDTVTNNLIFDSSSRTQKQLTVLCQKLNLTAPADTHLDLNILDTLQKELLNQCRDIAARYGGWVSEPFMNNLAIYFGYPESSDSDLRRAGRTALEITTCMKKRAALLFQQYGLNLSVQLGIHTGLVLVLRNQVPQGGVPNMAFDLVYKAKPGTVLVSTSSKKLLDPFLEFEEADKNQALPSERTYRLVGERRTEAFFYRRLDSERKSMVGRDSEKENILSKWKRADTEGTAVVIRGQAGIGKSRLVHEVKLEVQMQQRKVCECRCFPEHQNNALYPFLKMLRDYWGITLLDDTEKAVEIIEDELIRAGCAVDESLPLLCSWLSIPLSGEFVVKQMTSEEQKDTLFKTLKSSILQIDRLFSFLLIVEDLHWIDSTSIEFINYLLADHAEQHYMMLMTTRPEFNSLLRAERLPQIDLEALTKESISLMTQEYLGGKRISEKVANYIARRADGIPLFIEELTGMLVDQGYIVPDDNAYEFARNADLKKVPETTQALLNAKLDRLSFAKETAQLAAAIGREFSYDLLVKSSLKDEADVQSDLDMLVQAEIIYQQRSVRDNNYIFRHALIRDSAYDSMLPHFRKEIHSNIADVLMEFFPKRVEENGFEVAQHLAGAEQFDEAVDFGLKHTGNLAEKSLYHEALNITKEVKYWIENVQDEVEKRCSKLKLNGLLFSVSFNTDDFWTNNIDDVDKENEEILSFLKNENKEELVFELKSDIDKAKVGYAYYLHAKDRGNKALQMAGRMLEKEGDHTSTLSMVLGFIKGQRMFFNGNVVEAEKALNNIIKLEEEKKHEMLYLEFGFDPIVAAYIVLANIYAAIGEYEKVISCLDKGKRIAEGTKSSVDLVLVFVYKGFLMALFNEKEAVEQCLEEFRSSGLKEVTRVATLMPVVEDWINCEVGESLKIREKYIEAGETSYLIWYEVLIMDTLFKQKKFGEVYELAKNIEKRLVKNDEMVYLPRVYDFLACSLYRLQREETKEVISYLDKGIKLAQQSNNKWLELKIKYNYSKGLLENKQCNKEEGYYRSIEALLRYFPYNNTLVKSIKLLLTKSKENE